MKAIVCDGAVLSSLNPLAVEDYLRKKGWWERNRIGDRVSIWTRDSYSEDNLKIQLPLDSGFDDYPQRMYEIIGILEKAENRSQIDIVSELISRRGNQSFQAVVMNVETLSFKTSGNVMLLGVVGGRVACA